MPGKAGEFVNLDGSSQRRAYLASPLAFSRVTSSYGSRIHPEFGVQKPQGNGPWGSAGTRFGLWPTVWVDLFRAGKVDMATTWSFDILIRPLPLCPSGTHRRPTDNAWSKARPSARLVRPERRRVRTCTLNTSSGRANKPVANRWRFIGLDRCDRQPARFQTGGKSHAGTTRHGRCCRPSQRAVIRTRVGVSLPLLKPWKIKLPLPP